MWIIDPKTKEPSVSLTFFVLSVGACFLAGGLAAAGKLSTISIFPEMMYTATGLYFGRRFDLKSMGLGKAKE